jgi:hypothetical protein
MAKRPELKVTTPGDEPVATSDDTSQPNDAAVSEVAASGDSVAAPARVVATPTPARAAIPDQSQVDPDKIPYGKTVFTRQGHVCSTAPDPKRK